MTEDIRVALRQLRARVTSSQQVWRMELLPVSKEPRLDAHA